MKSLIIQQIEENGGFLSFADYMGLCLYHPKHGYYMTGSQKIGIEGDFYTSSSISEFYGAVMARWFIKKVEAGEIPPVFCEMGSGTGAFIQPFLNEWKRISPSSYQEGVVYCIETSPYHAAALDSLEVFVLSSIQELPDAFSGVFYSNELFDALPVQIAQNREGRIEEIGVGADQGKLIFKAREDHQDSLSDYLIWAEITLPEGYRAEIPIAMLGLLENLQNKLGNAYIVTADYGYFSEQLQTRKKGTIRGYKNHILIPDPFKHPFQMDLTYDIPLTAYIKKAAEFGWVKAAVQKKTEFFWENGLTDFLQETSDPNPFSKAAKDNRAIRSLLSHEGISESFYVLIHKKRG
ncbi:SAM-dependent methyltransferase [Metabacillus sp. KIGAM252]|uniref:SAM-dependent methyltransferase n=1 Tax=Metabacillus flavus TaxID=2823519 RepID=A0ABS5LGP5_9BACI|nr:SAM-dependent methyltransferase [Metabacillus flavus]MBS2969678.1 SAM-dependent methyltransferase [Metabacillus flavus]